MKRNASINKTYLGLISIVLSSIIDRTMNKIYGGSFIAEWTGGITIACLVIQVFGNSLGTFFNLCLVFAVNSYIGKALELNPLSDTEKRR